jgi:hypothetical protein
LKSRDFELKSARYMLRTTHRKLKKMAKSNDWLPSTRALILAMCGNWIARMTGSVRAAWGVPADQFAALQTLFGNAQALPRKAMDEAERTRVITGECQSAFAVLKEKTRFFRDRYFKMPPPTVGDWAALGFRQGV